MFSSCCVYSHFPDNFQRQFSRTDILLAWVGGPCPEQGLGLGVSHVSGGIWGRNEQEEGEGVGHSLPPVYAALLC